MATSSVAAALAIPHVVAVVDSFNELLPGVPASEENLQPLLEFLRKEQLKLEEPAYRITIHLEKSRGACTCLVAHVWGPLESSESVMNPVLKRSVGDYRVSVVAQGLEASTDGLAKALAWSKDMAKRVRDEDFCKHCRRDGFAADSAIEGRKGFPRKVLRARPLPMCAECALAEAVKAPPAKKPRRE